MNTTATARATKRKITPPISIKTPYCGAGWGRHYRAPAASLLFALRGDPQHFLYAGQTGCDLLRAGQAQAAHAVPERRAAQGDKVGIGRDQRFDLVVQQHDLVNPGPSTVPGIAALQATHGTLRPGWQGGIPRARQA